MVLPAQRHRCAAHSHRAPHPQGPAERPLPWPLDTAILQGNVSFGYLMPLREPRYRGMSELMSRAVDPTFKTLTTMALELADSFLRLHSLGFCYSDISFGNIFSIRSRARFPSATTTTWRSTAKARAMCSARPASWRRRSCVKRPGPISARSLFALGHLFYMFMVHHPLEGKREREIGCLDLPAMKKLYGTEALFIFDPKHGANRPVPGVHNNATLFWNLYPAYVRDIFTRAFTEGLRDPGARGARERMALSLHPDARPDFLLPQLRCGKLPGRRGHLPAPLVEQKCWFCQETPVPPMRLLIGRQSVVLNQDTLLYPHHLDANRRNDYSRSLGRNVPHPKRPDTWGLKMSPAKLDDYSAFGRAHRRGAIGPLRLARPRPAHQVRAVGRNGVMRVRLSSRSTGCDRDPRSRQRLLNNPSS